MINAAFRAQYVHWNKLKTRPEVEIVLSFPVEYENVVYEVLGGMPKPGKDVWVGVAVLDPKLGPDKEVEELPALPPTIAEVDSTTPMREPASARTRPPARALPQRVGRWCADIRNRRWAMDMGKVPDTAETTVAEWVRQFCKVPSRADILPGTEAEQLWNLIESACESENRV